MRKMKEKLRFETAGEEELIPHKKQNQKYRKLSDTRLEQKEDSRCSSSGRLKAEPETPEQPVNGRMHMEEKPSESRNPEASSLSGKNQASRKYQEFSDQKQRQNEDASGAGSRSRIKETSAQSEKLTEDKTDSAGDSPVAEQLRHRQNHNVYEKSRMKKSRLLFDARGTVPMHAVHVTGSAVSRSVAGDSKADENISAEAAEKSVRETSRAAQSVHRTLKANRSRTHNRTTTMHASSRVREMLNPRAGSDASELRQMGQVQQKRRIRKDYAKGFRFMKKNRESGSGGSAVPRPTLLNRIRNLSGSAPRRGKGVLAVLGSLGVFALLLVSVLGAGGTMTTQAEGVVTATTYLAEDEDILAAEEQYLNLEKRLQDQIDSIETDYPGYDEYVYQIDEIGHNPYHLISFLTVMFGEFRYADIVNSIQGLFEQQYTMKLEDETETVTETRTIRAGESLGNVVTSGYCSCEICCGKSDGITASGKRATANHTIAVDMDNPFVPMGTHVIMNGREYVVEDVGAFDRYGVQFDVFYDDHQTASAHGHKTWEARLADDNGEEVEVTETREVKRLLVKVTNNKLDLVVRSLLDEEQLEEYMTYNSCYGNKEYLFGTENLPGEGGYAGIKYEIPPEALKDKQFKAMITEAEKYLGMAYKWGGKKPSVGFDCSGFVSWVINHCGVGWDYGSRGAEALCGLCTYVSPSEAKPGDLVFFERTYDVDGVSHVGIYVGEHMMIHCGDPIQYTNLEYQYWKDHFLCFGRLPSP